MEDNKISMHFDERKHPNSHKSETSKTRVYLVAPVCLKLMAEYFIKVALSVSALFQTQEPAPQKSL